MSTQLPYTTKASLLSLLLLSGCNFGLSSFSDSGDSAPGLFDDSEPPTGGGSTIDTSIPTVPDDDDDSDVEEEEPEDPDTESGSSSATEPSVTQFIAYEQDNKIRFDFVIVDEDNDMNGGSVTLTVAGTQETLDFPDEVRRDGSQYFLLRDASDFNRSQPYEASFYARDSGNRRSDTVTASFERGPWSITVPENGDDRTTASRVGVMEFPAVIQGDLYGTGSNMDGSYSSDIDWIYFEVSNNGNRSLELTWSAVGADYDLFVIDAETDATLNAGVTTDPSETLTQSFTVGKYYYIAVAGWSGSAGSWTLQIN